MLAGPGGTERLVVEARQAMGTHFEIALPVASAAGGEEDAGARTRLLAAAEGALDEVERLEAQLSAYREESEISGLNARAADGPVRVEPRLFALLRLALELSEAVGGAFDPTVRPLLECWGFTRRGPSGWGRLPDAEELAAARAVTGAGLLELDPEALTLRFRRPGVSLDLGAIGKGYGIDRAIETLQDAGVTRALIHAGTSTVYGMGAGPDGMDWRVAIRDPRGEEQCSLGVVSLRDRALSVSAPHGRAFQEGDRVYGHVLDPRTGEPARAALLAAVSHPSAGLTDALSTALLVLGTEGLQVLAARYPEADLLVVEEREGDAAITVVGPGVWQFRAANSDGATVVRDSA